MLLQTSKTLKYKTVTHTIAFTVYNDQYRQQSRTEDQIALTLQNGGILLGIHRLVKYELTNISSQSVTAPNFYVPVIIDGVGLKINSQAGVITENWFGNPSYGYSDSTPFVPSSVPIFTHLCRSLKDRYFGGTNQGRSLDSLFVFQQEQSDNEIMELGIPFETLKIRNSISSGVIAMTSNSVRKECTQTIMIEYAEFE